MRYSENSIKKLERDIKKEFKKKQLGIPFCEGDDQRRKLKPRKNTSAKNCVDATRRYLKLKIKDFSNEFNIKFDEAKKDKTMAEGLMSTMIIQAISGDTDSQKFIAKFVDSDTVSEEAIEAFKSFKNKKFGDQWQGLFEGFMSGKFTKEEFALYASKLKDATEVTETIKKIDGLQSSVNVLIESKKNER